MFMHVSIVQLNARVTVWNMCGIPCVCVHVCLLYITLMHVSTRSRVSLQMTGKSHKCVIIGTLHKFMGFLCRHLAEDKYPHRSSHSFLWEDPALRQKALVLKRQANADRFQSRFQRLWVLSHETEEDAKVMTIWEKCRYSLTSINYWLLSGIWSFTKGIRSASLFYQILQGNFFSLLSYSFSSACCREINC